MERGAAAPGWVDMKTLWERGRWSLQLQRYRPACWSVGWQADRDGLTVEVGVWALVLAWGRSL